MEMSKVRDMLNADLELLMEKRNKFIRDDKEKSALDTTRLIKDTIELIARLPQRIDEWITMTSCYGMIKPEFDNLPYDEMIPSEHFVNVISVWEQNQNEEIRNHKIYERGEQIK